MKPPRTRLSARGVLVALAFGLAIASCSGALATWPILWAHREARPSLIAALLSPLLFFAWLWWWVRRNCPPPKPEPKITDQKRAEELVRFARGEGP